MWAGLEEEAVVAVLEAGAGRSFRFRKLPLVRTLCLEKQENS